MIAPRRAAGLTLLALTGALLVIPARYRLRVAQETDVALHAAAAEADRTPSPLGFVPARGRQAAAEASLGAFVRDAAVRRGALIELLEPASVPSPAAVSRHIVASGSAAAVLRLVDDLERRRPLTRLPRYTLAATASGRALRLDASIVTPWAE